MAAASNYLENKLIDHVLRGQAFPVPVIYAALFSAAPSDSGGGTELTGGAYARVKTAAGAAMALTDWKSTQNDNLASTGTGGLSSNSNPITFPVPTANWGTATHFALFDALTGGNLLFHGALSAPKTINLGDPAPYFPAGSLTVTVA